MTILRKEKINIEDSLVQYYVVNSELNMSKGKVSAQVAHVATIIAFENLYNCKNANKHIKFMEWYKNDQKKIVLRGKQKDLEKFVEQGFYYVRDNGLTEVPENSLTTVGLGVMWKSEAQKYIKRLQLL